MRAAFSLRGPLPPGRASRGPLCPASLLVALALAVCGCNNTSNSSSTTTPSTPKTTDTLTGTVQVKGSSFQPFTVSTTGEVDVTLTAAGPPATIAMGVGIGTTGSGSCALIPGASAVIAAGGSLPPGILSPGTFCVQVYDVGNQTGAITWIATVTHP